MLAAVDWSSLTVAAAFIIGVVVGGLAVARVTRNVMTYLRNEQTED